MTNYSRKFSLLVEKLERDDHSFLNIIDEDIAYNIFLYMDKYECKNLFKFLPFLFLLKKAYPWLNKLELYYPIINIKFLTLNENFVQHPSVNINIYYKAIENIEKCINKCEEIKSSRVYETSLFKIIRPDKGKFLKRGKINDTYTKIYGTKLNKYEISCSSLLFSFNTLINLYNIYVINFKHFKNVLMIYDADYNDIINIMLECLFK